MRKLIMIGGAETFRALAALEVSISLDEIQMRMRQALRDKFGYDEDGCSRYYVIEAFPEYIITRGPEDKMYRMPCTIQDDNTIDLGDPQEVETAYIAVQQSACFLSAAGVAGSGDEDGWSWPVQIMAATSGSTGRVTVGGKQVAIRQVYPPEVIAQVAAAANGARLGRRHPVTDGEEQDPARFMGWLSDTSFNGTAALGKANLLKSETAMRDKLIAARDAKKLDLFGLSVLAYFNFKPGKLGNEDVLVAQSLGKLLSVDMCGEPAAAGKFLAAASSQVMSEIAQLQSSAIKTSQSGNNHGSPKGAGRNGEQMKNRILALLAALAASNAGRAAELTTEFNALPENQQGEFLGKITEAFTAASATQNSETLTQAKAALAEAQSIQAENKKNAFRVLLETKLSASKLPAPAVSLVRSRYIGEQGAVTMLAEDSAIDSEIKSTRDAFAAFSNVGRISNHGVVVGLDGADKVQLAMCQMLGVKEAFGKGVPAFRGLKDAYVHLSGDHDLSQLGSGGLYRSALAAGDPVGTADFPNILLDAMHKKLLQDWAELGMQGLDALYEVGPAINDFRSQNRVRDGYFGDLNDVGEGADYQAINKPTDEKVSFSVGKKGGILTISEETIRNDDLGSISRWPNKLARAGRHTLKVAVTNKFVTNPNYGADGLAWYHATHNNLSAVALSIASLNANEISLAAQAEKDSNNPLGLTLDWLMVPYALKATAYQINQSEYVTGQIGIANPWYHRFGENNERIIVNAQLVDATDYYYGTDKSNAPCVEVAFLDGIQTPQILMANDPRIGKMFTTDQIQYKVKWAYGIVITDFRGVGKAVVAG